MSEKKEQDLIEERKEKVIKFLKEKKDWISYLILSLIVFMSVFIRTRNIPKLKDVTTGTWTLGPDLDPFLFLRWAKYIVEHGSLFVIDSMRSVPLADICSGAMCNPVSTASEMKLLPYMIAWFYHFLSFFSPDVSVTYAAVLFPAVMFGFTIIAFFLFARQIFYKEDKMIRNIIALISTAIFAVIPSLLPRTIAGIPEKESVAFFFLFLAFYLFLKAFDLKEFKKKIIFGILAGFFTALMALTWGAVIFIFFAIPAAVLLAFILGKIKIKELCVYGGWLITSFLIMMPFSTRYTLKNLVASTSTGLALGVVILIGTSLIIMKNKQLKSLQKKTKLPKELFALIISGLILIVVIAIVLGPSFILGQLTGIKNSLITPMTSRFGLTVAENKQPFFINDWKNSFGPVFYNIPLYFWLFFAGVVALFNSLIKKLEKQEKLILTSAYFIFLICLIFSRYSPNSILNGTSGLSLLIYFGGWILLLGVVGYFYYKDNQTDEASLFEKMNFNYILYFIILTLGIIAARSGIRLIMVLGAVSPVAIGFLIVKISQRYLKEKDETIKILAGVIALIIIVATLFTFWSYYKADRYTAENFAPGIYQWQWQKSMEWVRENTASDAVFAHWWDYGYWVQSIGERATILDGGNAVVYWNHLMGRHVLTGPDEMKALEFLYPHNGTHLLIDSTEIGKYTAYSSIGSDENYDRFSWIMTFLMNEKQTQETNNETIFVYPGGSVIDEDIVWEENGKEIFLPKKRAGVGAILIRQNNEKEILQPEAVFVYNNNQYRIPLRYAYFNDELHDFKTGLDSGVFLFPRLTQLSDGRSSFNELGAAMYLSRRTVHSQVARLYLFNQSSDYFKLVHSQDGYIVDSLKNQGVNIKDFVYYNGFQGPIKIWEVSYPENIEYYEEYLEINFPNQEINLAKSGEY